MLEQCFEDYPEIPEEWKQMIQLNRYSCSNDKFSTFNYTRFV